MLHALIAAAAMAALPAVAPSPDTNPATPAKVELGKQLFFDPRLSTDGTVSCNSCHNLMAGGEDNRPTAAGVGGKLGGRSSPTVWNAAFQSSQFWDGRAASLEEQAKGPITNPIEMAMKDHDFAMERLRVIPGYIEAFKKVYPKDAQPVSIDNAAKAIAAFERTLVTPNSKFDKFVAGNKKALNAQEQRGWQLVQDTGCTACHSGVNFSGPALPAGTPFLQKFPVFAESDYVKKYDLTSDPGRFESTKQESDRGMWRVPTWRNVALTAPYFHNGSVATLDEAVRVMAKVQLNKDLKDTEVQDIVAFLNTLTGERPKLTMPVLPATPGTTVTPRTTAGAH